MPTSLPIARYRFSARVVDALQLPPYAGSLLRGQFGAALRHLACMTRQSTCAGCPLLATCPYTRIFEAPAPDAHQLQRFSAIPNAYVVEPPPPLLDKAAPSVERSLQPGQELVFHMVLIGHALEQLPLVIVAWQRALARGLGKSRSRLELEQVQWLDGAGQSHPVWTASQPHIQPHAASLSIPPLPSGAQALHLHIHTPLRLQKQGHALPPKQLNVRTLISTLARRVALMLEFHAQQADWGAQVPTAVTQADQLSDQRDLRWFDWTRYSSRQQQEMALGGVVGQWQLHGASDTLAQLWPWLHLGQWLHVGKNATMGLGGYSLSAPPQA
ncbi:MAG TPA: CRISPR system precrRNA processing endoribonuclease RAMP protein Cas6 [Alicycliphilus sp.]|nr:CRISPR system precrRNA processing endoribonuclease RAMP protein Cas6 [Alicycliphilus sp.]